MPKYECADCGGQIHPNESNCKHCGAELEWGDLTPCRCADCGGLVKYHYNKCSHCGAELIWKDLIKETEPIESPKKLNKIAMGCLPIAVICILLNIFLLSSDNTTSSNITSTTNSSLADSYHSHRNFIRTTCKAALKIDRGVEDGIEGPTYAGEYMGEFILKGWYGSSNDNQFSCIFKKSDNERGMDIVDVR